MIDGERWSNVSDETVRYFLGHYGDPAAPPDPEIADRVLSRPRAEELRTVEPLHLDGARARFGSGISDEELLLRLTMPEEQVEAMLSSPSACPPQRPPTPGVAAAARTAGASPIVTLLSEVGERPEIVHLRVEKDDEVVEWRRAT